MIQPLASASPSAAPAASAPAAPPQNAAASPGSGPVFDGASIPKPVLDGFETLALKLAAANSGSTTSIPDVVRAFLGKVYNPKPRDPAGDLFATQTQDLRDSLVHGRDLAAQLASMKPDDPDYARVKAELEAVEATLGKTYGYSLDDGPRPSSLWLDPQFLAAELPGGQVNASQFPSGTPVLTPPDPMTALFPQKRPYKFAEKDNVTGTAQNPEQYRELVAKHRADTDMPVSDGEPIGVQVDFQGGGGKGKRYLPALQEMLNLGVVPTSVSGSSAGAIAAGLMAAGATPKQLADFVLSPELAKFLDIDLRHDDGGVANGQVAFNLFDQTLRDITGIEDRPVTFADLKIPLTLLATKYSDTDPAPGTEDLSQPKNRTFVFSQATTPDTPVALAIRASMAIPFVFDPVQMTDAATGRRVTLADGGVINNFPVGFGTNTLPEIGISLLARNEENAASHPLPERKIPGGQLDGSHLLWNGANGWDVYADSNIMANDFRKRAAPGPNQFMLGLPIWDLNHPSNTDSVLDFPYDPKKDPAMDVETTAITRDFLQKHLADLRIPGKSATNVITVPPEKVSFDVPGLSIGGREYTAHYAGGDSIVFRSGTKEITAKVGQKKVDSIYLDSLAFNDLTAQLQHLLEVHVRTFGLLDRIL